MCLLCYYPPQAPTNLDALEISCLNNPDGFGWSALDAKSGEIKTFHSMNADEVISTFETERKQNPDSYALFHSRLATAGTVTTDNCHPFRVGGGFNAVLAHNGHLPVDIRKGDKRSDTRVFAEDLFPERITALDSRKRFAKLEKWARGNKLVILSADPRLQKPVYLVNEGSGLWDQGVWYSNTSYQFDQYNWGAPLSWSNPFNDRELMIWEQVEEGFCPNCALEYDWFWAQDYGVCINCRFCFDCLNSPADCLCHTPQRSILFGGAYDSRSTLGS